MYRPAGMSSESEEESDLESCVPLNAKEKKYGYGNENLFQPLWNKDANDDEILQNDGQDVRQYRGFDSLSITDPKVRDGKHFPVSDDNESLRRFPSKSSLGDVSNWNFSGDTSSYNEKENYRYRKTDSPYPKGRVSPSPTSYSTHPTLSPRAARNWRKFRMHEGVALPLEDMRMAVVQGNLLVVKALLAQGIMVDQILRGGWTSLMFAASCGKHELVRYLLQQAADPNMHKEMFTALMAACASSRENEKDLLLCVNHLIDFGAKADACERHRMTPLMFACKEGRADIVDRLIEAKVNVNKQDNKGWTALCWAATKGYGKIVRRLLEATADPTKTNLHGQRPADIALAAGHSQLADILERATLKDINSACEPTSTSVPVEQAVVPKVIKLENTLATHCGEMEMVLSGLDLSDLIPVFQANKITLEYFLRLSENDFEKMGIEAVGTRKKLLESIAQIHKQEWKTTSLPNLMGFPYITLPDAVAMVRNINKHLRFIHASIGHLRDQIQATPRILQLGQEKHTVSTLSTSFSVSLKNLSYLGDEVKFFKAHLDQVSSNAEFSSADTIVLKQDDGRQWQRSLLASLVVTTSVATILYFCRPRIFTWLFSMSPYPQRSVFLDVP